MFTYPASDNNRVDQLMAVLGSFWSQVYTDPSVVERIMTSRGQTSDQAYLEMLDVVHSLSRHDTPIFRKDNWYYLTLKASDKNAGDTGLIRYGDDGLVYGDSVNQYGRSYSDPTFNWDLDISLNDVSVILNRITSSSRTWIKGQDFVLSDTGITFINDPFDDDGFVQTPVFEDNEIVDQEIGLWLFRGDFDFERVFTQWGYILDLELKSSVQYRNYLNVIFDALVEGTTVKHIRQAFALLAGIPIAIDTETVQDTVTFVDKTQVITDKNVYTLGSGANLTVAAKDELIPGDTLSTALQFFEFNQGEVPDPSLVSGLMTGRALLSHGFFGEIYWENAELELKREHDENGRLKVSWDASGWPGDVDKLFDDIHARGLESGKTLAEYLGAIRVEGGYDAEGTMPDTINPMAFLVQNMLRKFAMLVRVRTSGTGHNPIGLFAATILRKIIPPHTTVLIQVELEYTEGPVMIGGSDSELTPRYIESITPFVGNFQTETTDSSRISEDATLRLVRGSCR